jgi:hypothetical protein
MFASSHHITMDIFGSVIVAGYLLWSGLRMAQKHLGDVRTLFHRAREHSG